MGKAPSFQFYPNDWARDLEEHPLEIEGAWIRICCKLWWSETRGEATKTLEQWAKILREKKKKTEKILQYLIHYGICDLVNQNGNITIKSRRMIRDEYIRNIRKIAGEKGGNPSLIKGQPNPYYLLNQKDKQGDKQKITPSSSSSSSNIKEYNTAFSRFWFAYPKKTGKKAAWKAWNKAKDKPDIESILNKISLQIKSEQWKNGYIPNPTTWLNQGRWEDEVKSQDTKEENPYVQCPNCKREVWKRDLEGDHCVHCIPRKPLSEILKMQEGK